PWVQELIALAWKHPNLYIGCGAHAPKYWDPALVQFLNSRGKGKVLWGTDYPVVRHQDSLEQVAAIDLKPESRALLMRGAAEKVFKSLAKVPACPPRRSTAPRCGRCSPRPRKGASARPS